MWMVLFFKYRQVPEG